MIFFTSKMAYQTEIIAILSAGRMSFKRLMWPYFLSAAAITLLSLGLNLYVIPAANGERLKLEMRLQLKRIKGIKYDQQIHRQIEPWHVQSIPAATPTTSRACIAFRARQPARGQRDGFRRWRPPT